MKKTLNINGLDCAACAAELEEILSKTQGVTSASVSFVMQKIVLEYEDEAALQRAKKAANGFEEVKVIEEVSPESNEKPGETGGEQSENTVLKLENLHCAACAAALEEKIAAIKGVKNARVDYVGQKIFLSAESKTALEKAVKTANAFEKVRVLNGDEALGEAKADLRQTAEKSAFGLHGKEFMAILVSAALFLTGIVLDKAFPFAATRVLSYVCYAAAYLASGWRVLLSTAKNIVKGRVFDENFLMTIASVGAVILGDYAEGVAVMLLYTLGEWLQAVAVGSSRRSVTDLMALKSESANLIKKNNGLTAEQAEEAEEAEEAEVVITVPPEQLREGDEVLVRAGEKIPCDGVLLSASASVDTKSLTGEAAYREVKTGDELLSGYINAGEVFRMRVTKEYKNSAVARILDLMENSAAQKAKSEKFITKFSRYYTPAVCIAALIVAFAFPLYDAFFGGGYTQNLARWIRAALNFLVISCPCALIISVPLTYFCAIGACAKEGVLVKGATYLDVLAKAQIIAFDKTGTLTKGDFAVNAIHAAEPFTNEEVLAFAEAAESNSAHPVARAFAEVYAGGAAEKTAYKTLFAKETAGGGIAATLQGESGRYEVLCGKAEFLQENGITPERVQSSLCTAVYVAVNGAFAGSVEIGDHLRETAKEAVLDLKASGAKKTVMLTGDTAQRAESVANEAGLDEWKAGLLPDEKLAAANELKKQGALIYVGDGINDAPVMAAADCAASMGKLGAAAAVEASDVVLVSDDLFSLAKGRRTAKKAQRIVKENIVFSIACKAAFLIGSLAGIVPLWLAVFADVGVMTIAVLNALRMLKRKIR
ncbi:MAG: heavy metal translocating P-type ATPase [Candidatus Scatosoma sp.]